METSIQKAPRELGSCSNCLFTSTNLEKREDATVVGHVEVKKSGRASSLGDLGKDRASTGFPLEHGCVDRGQGNYQQRRMAAVAAARSSVRGQACCPRSEGSPNHMFSLDPGEHLKGDYKSSWQISSVASSDISTSRHVAYHYRDNASPYSNHHYFPVQHNYPDSTFAGKEAPSPQAHGFGYGMPPTPSSHTPLLESHHQLLGGQDLTSAVVTAYAQYQTSTPTAARGYPVIQWAPIAPVEYVSNIKPDDVLSGRGGATNSHSGNRVFRSLVKRYQDQYLRAKKRDKPTVASIIVEKIREKGGRFLRRVDAARYGQVLWFDIGDDRAREKASQALREGAPEIRRKRKAASADEDDTKRSESADENERKLGSTFSSTEQTPVSIDDKVVCPMAIRRTTGPSSSDNIYLNGNDSKHCRSLSKDGPVMIRPFPELLQARNFLPIAVDQLDPLDREIYLRDFLPPDPTIRRKTTKSHVLEVSGYNKNVGPCITYPWSVVKV